MEFLDKNGLNSINSFGNLLLLLLLLLLRKIGTFGGIIVSGVRWQRLLFGKLRK